MRFIGLDVGERRIGVAAADDRVGVAVPVTTVEVRGEVGEALGRIVQEQMADEVVVGMPYSMSGALGPQAQSVMELIEALEARTGVPVRTHDERLTTVEAERRLRSGAERGRKPARDQERGRKDAMAAAIMLQAYLDGRRVRPS